MRVCNGKWMNVCIACVVNSRENNCTEGIKLNIVDFGRIRYTDPEISLGQG